MSLLILLASNLPAQWDARPRLYIEPKATIVHDTSAGLAIDLDITYNNEGPDTLFMFIEVPQASDGNLNVLDMSVPHVPVHLDGWGLDDQWSLNLERTIPSYANNGHRMADFYAIALPSGQSRNVYIHLRIGAQGFHQPEEMRMRLIGTTYTHEFDQALEEGRWSSGPAPTNPHGRRLYAFDVTVQHRAGQEDIVHTKVVTKPLEEPYTYSQPLAQIERLLKEWEGITPWSVSRVGEVILLKHKDMGQYYSALSPSRRVIPESHWYACPVEIGITLLRHVPKQKLMRQYMTQPNVTGRCQDIQEKAGEYKVSAFDTKLPKVQRKLERHYHIFPTHFLDPKHDILVFTYGPAEWVALVEDDPVTRDYKALCQYIRQNFNPVWRGIDVWYLGNIGKKMLGIP